MKIADLILGDIIFFTNRYTESDGSHYDYVDHVGLFAGYDALGNPEVIHSIIGGGHYELSKRSGLCKSTLRALDKQIQKDNNSIKIFDVKFSVFRCANPDVAYRAFCILNAELKYPLPYDEKRLDEKLAKEDLGLDGNDFKSLAEEAYKSEGLFRSIKYAARFPLPLVRTRQLGVGRGLTCSMAVILAYQIAELKLADAVTSVTSFIEQGTDVQWVSDLYAPEPTGDVPQVYLEYLKKLKVNHAIVTENSCVTGYDCWKLKTPINEYEHTTFPVDSKLIGAEGLYVYLQANATNPEDTVMTSEVRPLMWAFKGALDVPFINFSEAERKASRESTLRIRTQSCMELAQLAEHLPHTVSPSPTPTPLSNDGSPSASRRDLSPICDSPFWAKSITSYSACLIDPATPTPVATATCLGNSNA